MNFELMEKVGAIGNDRFCSYIESIVSGDGNLAGRMSSGPGGAIHPFDRISPDLKAIGKRIASELPSGWNTETIEKAVAKELGLSPE